VYYLLVEVPEAVHISALRRKLQALKPRGIQVVGIYSTPEADDMCECGPLTEREQKEQTGRGIKRGWWIHLLCKKARPTRAHMPINLLEKNLAVTRKRFFVTVHPENM
jgi:hypothetical protein